MKIVTQKFINYIIISHDMRRGEKKILVSESLYTVTPLYNHSFCLLLMVWLNRGMTVLFLYKFGNFWYRYNLVGRVLLIIFKRKLYKFDSFYDNGVGNDFMNSKNEEKW